MINSVFEISKEKPQIDFPLLAEDKRGVVVLFTNKNSGTVLESGKTLYGIGYNSYCWPDVTNGVWKILPKGSKVIIKQA